MFAFLFQPYMTYWSRFFRLMATGSIVCFMISVVMGAVLGTIIYRISLVSIIYSGFDGAFIKSHAKLFTSMTAALINLIIIMLLTKVYLDFFFLVMRIYYYGSRVKFGLFAKNSSEFHLRS